MSAYNIGLLILTLGVAGMGLYRLRAYALWLFEDLCSQEDSEP